MSQNAAIVKIIDQTGNVHMTGVVGERMFCKLKLIYWGKNRETWKTMDIFGHLRHKLLLTSKMQTMFKARTVLR